MKEEKKLSTGGWLKSASVFALCLAAIFLLPFVVIYGGSWIPVRDQLFFFPQRAFPYDLVVSDHAGVSRRVFGEHAIWLSVLQWSVVGAAFSYFTRRMSVLKTALVAVVSILIVAVIVELVIRWSGAYIAYDGP